MPSATSELPRSRRYRVLFCGRGTLQFGPAAINCARRAARPPTWTGEWSKKAVKEARGCATAHRGEFPSRKFTCVPLQAMKVRKDAAYVHDANETIVV